MVMISTKLADVKLKCLNAAVLDEIRQKNLSSNSKTVDFFFFFLKIRFSKTPECSIILTTASK